MAEPRHTLTRRSKGQSHTFTKTVTVAWFPVKCAAEAVCYCCRHGTARRMTAYGGKNIFEMAYTDFVRSTETQNLNSINFLHHDTATDNLPLDLQTTS